MLDLESGLSDVSIPKSLSLKRLPYSFRYYHLILSFIQENIDPNRKKYLSLKNKINIAFENNRSVKAELGLINHPDKNKKEKLSYKTD